MLYVGLYREKHEKSSCQKPQDLEPYLVLSIIKWSSAQFVQIIPLGPKMAPPPGPHALHRLI